MLPNPSFPTPGSTPADSASPAALRAQLARARSHTVGGFLRRTGQRGADRLAVVNRDRWFGPKYVVLVHSLPKNPSGEILGREVPERYGDLGRAQ